MAASWPSFAQQDSLCPLPDEFASTIELTGLNGELEANARAILTSQLQLVGANLNRVRFEFAISDGAELIEQSLEPFGYYSPAITSDWFCDETLRLSYQVDVGIPIIINNRNVQILGPGVNNPQLQDWLAEFPLQNGERLVQPDYSRAKRRALSLTSSLGYFDAQYQQARIAIDREQATADIDLELVTGVRYELGDVSYQQPHMSNALIDRYIKLNPGDQYDINDIAQLQSDLYASGFFSVVDIQAEPNRETHTVPVSISMQRAKQNAFNFGVGYSTDTGPRGSFNWTRRWLNPQGHSAEFDSRWAEDEQSASLTYRIPGRDPARENQYYRVGYVADDERENYGNTVHPAKLIIDIERFFAQVGWVRQRGNWTFDYYLQGQKESLLVTEDVSDTLNTAMVFPGVELRYLKSDDLFRPTQGFSFSARMRAATELLGSDTDILYFSSNAVYTQQFTPKHQLTLRGWLGTNLVNDETKLPANFRFYQGGDTTVRGYNYRELGPNQNGYLTGGASELGFTAEYEYFMWPDVALAVFTDTGDAFFDRDFDLNQSIGVGFHWYSPVGPIRIDYAAPVDAGETPKLHIIIRANL